MEISGNNMTLWNPFIQLGMIAALLLIANTLRQKIKFVRNSLMPTAVLAGFLMLALRSAGWLPIDTQFMEAVTYHAIALGFIAQSLRTPEKHSENTVGHAARNGALIVSTYLVQVLVGLAVSVGLAYTFMPEMFQAGGILLAMAFGQGPGQANNVGSTYEALGFEGGRSFGLTLAAVGYLVACTVGVIYLNVLNRKKKIVRVTSKEMISGSTTVDTFQDKNEIPVSESVDRFSIQAALVVGVYLLTYLLTLGVSVLLETYLPGVAKTITPLLWGFNFIVGSMVALAVRGTMNKLRKVKVMTRQYNNNYLLSRISGVAFDFMIVAGIASSDLRQLEGLWIPFIAMVLLGAVGTFVYLRVMCKKLYPAYADEGFFAMFGMLTGTISSGVLLLREIDPEFKTPASNDLITGSSFGIMFGAPLLLLISYAAQSAEAVLITIGLASLYLAILLVFMMKKRKAKKKE